MNALHRWIAIRRYRLAVAIHAVRSPVLTIMASDRTKDRGLRNRQIELLNERWNAKGPKPEHYGLGPEDSYPETIRK